MNEDFGLPSVAADAAPQVRDRQCRVALTSRIEWPDNGSPFGNRWFRDLPTFIECLRRFEWYKNSRFKYVGLRIDTRDGYFLVSDRDGNRSTPDDLFPYPEPPAAPRGQLQAEARIRELEEALKPFAEAADEYDLASSGEPVTGIIVPVGDCYAARTALSTRQSSHATDKGADPSEAEGT